MPPRNVPTELIDRVLSHLDGVADVRTLRSTAVVSSTFLTATRRRQLYSATLAATEDIIEPSFRAHSSGKHQLLLTNPIFATFIRELHLVWPGSSRAEEDASFFAVVKLLAESPLLVREMSFGMTAHVTLDGGWGSHQFNQQELFEKLVVNASGYLHSVTLQNPCSLFPMSLLGQMRSLKNLSIWALSEGCGMDENDRRTLNLIRRPDGAEPIFLECLELCGYMPYYLPYCITSPHFPAEFSRLKSISIQLFRDEQNIIWERLSKEASRSINFLTFGSAEYGSDELPIDMFSGLQYLYICVEPGDLLHTIDKEKFPDGFPASLKRFGIILDTLEEYSLPKYSEVFIETLDALLTSRLREDMRFDFFVLGRHFRDINKLTEEVRGWFQFLEENELLGRCGVFNIDRRSFCKDLAPDKF